MIRRGWRLPLLLSLWVIGAGMCILSPCPVAHAQDVILTDPLVRQTQIGPPPTGLVTGVNPRTGLGVAVIPGIGLREVRLVGVPVSWAGRRVVQAVDLSSGIEFPAVLPEPPRLVAATVARVSGDTVLVRRLISGQTVTEAVPVASVFVTREGNLSPAIRVTGALRAGARVLIPPDRSSWARVIVRKTR